MGISRRGGLADLCGAVLHAVCRRRNNDALGVEVHTLHRGKKLLYAFTFPLFMLTFVPICIAAMFKNPGWQPIVHTRTMESTEVQDMKKTQKISA